MYQVTPYLFFSGRCEEALSFYQRCFGGVVLSKQYFKDSPQQIEGADPNWIMHAEFEAFGMKLMLSDGVVARELSGNNIALSVVLDDLDEQARLYDKLATEGHVMMPLADTFWGARFGKVEDKFGVRWMLHCELVK
ncbi:MAG: VOC family protein [Pseudomonadota bacterium]|uniref:VOC family protein n=1 Tax=Photobacterium sp. (strain ATCC 43367) TaxID=379097 RepID=UPI0020484092|nr:VOC family protein [Vibrio sinaloensis]UPQ88356.1 VOC family protein [Vibrio sinaloensis]